MLRDAEYFKSRLSKIDGAGDVGDYILGVVQNKVVEGWNDKGKTSGDGGESLTAEAEVPSRAEAAPS